MEKDKHKILFLDVDGVLNHEKFYTERYERLKNGTYDKSWPLCEFCPESVSNLNRIVKETDCKVVVSSTWRSDDNLQDIFYAVGLDFTIYDITPYHVSRIRGTEIDMWLEAHKDEVESYVIVDDDDDMLDNQRNRFVRTEAYKDGLNVEKTEEIIRLFND